MIRAYAPEGAFGGRLPHSLLVTTTGVARTTVALRSVSKYTIKPDELAFYLLRYRSICFLNFSDMRSVGCRIDLGSVEVDLKFD